MFGADFSAKMDTQMYGKRINSFPITMITMKEVFMAGSELKVTGYDEKGQPVSMPDTIDEYYAGVPKRYAGIRKMIMTYESPVTSEGVRIKGDFALLKALLADHDRELSVIIRCNGEALGLFFPAYVYGFVEDTFARAIHHKIEGIGYTLRECIGKYEIRIREYDDLFFRVIQTDASAASEAGKIALLRLLHPMNLTKEHESAYLSYLKERDAEVLSVLTEDPTDARETVAFLTENALLSENAIKKILPRLSDTSLAPVVAMLLRYMGEIKKSTPDGGGRMSLF